MLRIGSLDLALGGRGSTASRLKMLPGVCFGRLFLSVEDEECLLSLVLVMRFSLSVCELGQGES